MGECLPLRPFHLLRNYEHLRIDAIHIDWVVAAVMVWLLRCDEWRSASIDGFHALAHRVMS